MWSFAPTGRKLIALGSNVETESRPEGAEPNVLETNVLTPLGRRFALPWAISLCPFGAGEMGKPRGRPSPSRYQMYPGDFV